MHRETSLPSTMRNAKRRSRGTKRKINSLKYDMGKGSGNRQGAVTRALFFSVPQECAACIHRMQNTRGLGTAQQAF